jgi:hypothetical protein
LIDNLIDWPFYQFGNKKVLEILKNLVIFDTLCVSENLKLSNDWPLAEFNNWPTPVLTP